MTLVELSCALSLPKKTKYKDLLLLFYGSKDGIDNFGHVLGV